MASLEDKQILTVTFNQDNTCVALGTTSGIIIYNLALHKCIYTYNIGAIRTVQMLFCTSLVAYVGAGLQPALTPRKLTLLNTATSETIQDLSFPSVVLSVLINKARCGLVLSVLINKARLVAVLEQQVCVYALQSLAPLFTVDTPGNRRGLGALTHCDQPCLLALPAGDKHKGTLRVYNLLAASDGPAGTEVTDVRPAGPAPHPPAHGHAGSGGAHQGLMGEGGASVLCELVTHQSPLAAMAWYADGSLLATASTKGTVIRVHRLPAGACVAAFRRGTVPASIHALAWSPPHVQPPLLAVSSSRGSVHLFRLDEDAAAPPLSALGMRPAGGAGGVAAGLLSAVMRLAPGNTLGVPQPSIASIRLPVDGVPAAMGLLPRPARPPASAPSGGVQSSQGNEGRDQGDAQRPQDLLYDADSVTLVVAAVDGLLYEYAVTRLHSVGGQEGPCCNLEQESNLTSP